MKAALLIITCTLVFSRAYGEDVSDILNKISAEKETKEQTTVNSTAIRPVKAAEPAEKRKEPKNEALKAKTKKVVEQPKQQPAAPQDPRIIVYRPKDKLPKIVAGSGVAGDFVLVGEDPEGGASIVAAEDVTNYFPRTYIIKNVSSGYPRGTNLLFDNRTKFIHISPERPLIFICRESAGYYQVKAQ